MDSQYYCCSRLLGMVRNTPHMERLIMAEASAWATRLRIYLGQFHELQRSLQDLMLDANYEIQHVENFVFTYVPEESVEDIDVDSQCYSSGSEEDDVASQSSWGSFSSISSRELSEFYGARAAQAALLDESRRAAQVRRAAQARRLAERRLAEAMEREPFDYEEYE